MQDLMRNVKIKVPAGSFPVQTSFLYPSADVYLYPSQVRNSEHK